MAMGRPVVASRSCGDSIEATSAELMCVSGVSGFIRAISALLDEPSRAEAMGQAARKCVVGGYSWDAHMARIDPYITDIIKTVRPHE
jgi:glycosyltransferase involved in cell wall biosynthesis